MSELILRSTVARASRLKRLLPALSSLKLTLAIFVLLAATILAVYRGALASGWVLALPLGLLSLNILCAVATKPVFRRQGALLVFHLALVAIVALAALGRLTYLKGQLELSAGERFAGVLTQTESGPWHASRLDQVVFTNHGYTIEYQPGIKRDRTRNIVSWPDESGHEKRAVIGDQQPLALHGYRFYTSFNKGFAPVFIWHPREGGRQRGTIHLPSYPLHEYGQAIEWTPPGARTSLWVMLQFDEVLLNPERVSTFRVPERHLLVVRTGSERHELKPGGRLALPDGVLAYDGLSTWMGYNVFYDWTMPWLLAACLLAVASLGVHFWRKFAARQWEV